VFITLYLFLNPFNADNQNSWQDNI
jgi:hypothetical protein